MKTWANYYDEIAQDYATTHRISESCATAVVRDILTYYQSDNPIAIADLGCGDGYLSSLLLSNLRLSSCIFVDISNALLHRAIHRISRTNDLSRSLMVCANANAVPLHSNSIMLVLMAFLLHLVPDYSQVLNEISRILAPRGISFILTYDPDDLALDIYDEFFPGFREINLPRYPALSDLVKNLQNYGFSGIKISKHPYEISFQSVDDVMNLISMKPFSIFDIYPDENFSERLRAFELNLRRHFKQEPVRYSSKVSLISMKKSEG